MKARRAAMAQRADLHIHTKYSDGSLSPEEVVGYAKKIGLGCIAITDHDSTQGMEEAISAGRSCGIEIIPAVEISAEEDGIELHILGYCIDYKDTRIIDALASIREDRKKRLRRMVGLLNRHGFDIDADDLMKFAGDVSISRLHIARYMEARGLISSWRNAFEEYIGDEKPCYVVDFKLSSQDAIDLIKQVKGVSVVAHPGKDKPGSILPKLIAQGMGGIEAFHSEHTPSISQYYEKYARDHGLLVTGGSDCHGKTKKEMLMGKVTIPYSYVEELKKASLALA